MSLGRLFRDLHYVQPALRSVYGLILCMALLVVGASAVGLLIPYLGKLTFDRGIMAGNVGQILWYSLLALAALLLASILQLVGQVLYAIASNRFSWKLKAQVLQRTLNLPLEFFDKRQSGYVVGRVNEADSLSGMFSPAIFQFFGSLIEAVGALVIIVRISGQIALALLPFLLLFYLISRWMSGRIKSQTAVLVESYANSVGNMQEAVSAVADIKGFGTEDRKANELMKQFASVAADRAKQAILMAGGMNTMQFLFHSVSITVTIVAGISIARGQLTVGDYVALAAYASKMVLPVQAFGTLSLTFQPILVSLKRLGLIFESRTEKELWGCMSVGKLSGNIEFRDVSFGYDPAAPAVLRNCSFSVGSGECVAIYGRNGAGKSTVLKLALGFYPNYDGNVYVDGVELRDYDIGALRARIGIVSQNVFLFTGSLKDNIEMAAPQASEEEVSRVLRLSGCADIFGAEVDKVIVSELGRNLSGGQRQAAAIARCMLKNPDVLMFDEATAHLDANARQVVSQAIVGAFCDKTRVLITQDRDLASIADRIFLLEEGAMKEIERSAIP